MTQIHLSSQQTATHFIDLEGWIAEPSLKPPSGFEPGTQHYPQNLINGFLKQASLVIIVIQ